MVAKAKCPEPKRAMRTLTLTGKGWSKVPVAGKNLVLLAAMHIAVTLAGGWDLDDVLRHNAGQIYLPMGLGALMLADALLAHRQSVSALSRALRLQPPSPPRWRWWSGWPSPGTAPPASTSRWCWRRKRSC